jgi:hypothetical protein
MKVNGQHYTLLFKENMSTTHWIKTEWVPELTRRKILLLLPGTSAADINNNYVYGKYTRYTFVTFLIHNVYIYIYFVYYCYM